MSSEDPLESAVAGVTKGLIELSLDKIDEFVLKLKNRKLAFIEERKTIELVKEQYKSAEIKIYQNYVNNKEILFLIRMGLVLRKLESDTEKRQNLRDKVFRKFGIQGLHIAEFVQNGILNRYTGMLLAEISSVDELGKKITDVLTEIDKHALFIQGVTKSREILNKLNIIANANHPSIFVIAGFKSAAEQVRQSLTQIRLIFKDYELESISSGDKEILFFKRKLP